MLTPLLETGAEYNFARFSEPEVDDEIARIQTLPLDEQADAWGALDEMVGTTYLPVIPTSFLNDLYVFGEAIGNPTGDGRSGRPTSRISTSPSSGSPANRRDGPSLGRPAGGSRLPGVQRHCCISA